MRLGDVAMLTSRQVHSADGLKRWLPLAIIGLVAVTAGIALPQAMPSAPTAAAVPAAAKISGGGDAAGKGKWAYTPPSVPEPPDAKAMLTRLGVATAFVLVLCVVTLWLGKRWLGSTAQPIGPTNQMRLLEMLPLGNRCAVYLIQVANRPVLIGTDPSGLKTVVPLPESFSDQAFGTPGDPDQASNAAEGPAVAKLYQRAMEDESEPAFPTR
jgi:flagellar biogenesis protein FliO